MKKLILLSGLTLGLALNLMAQEDLLGELEKEDAQKVKQEIAIATFKGTRIINMPSVEMTGVGNLQFMITHHFGEIWNKDVGAGQNFANFFGINSGIANTYMSFDYSVKPYLNLGVGMAGIGNYQGWAKVKLMRQQTGLKNYPVSVAWMSTFNVDANESTDAAYKTTGWNRFSFLHQLLIARKFTEEFSLQLTPSMVHYNIVPYGYENNNNVFSMGIGGRYKISAKKAITFEYSRQFNMYKNVMDRNGNMVSYVPDVVSLGYDMDTGGHIFQFFVSNTNFANNISQLSITPKRGWSLGFNLNRSYGIKKVVNKSL